MADEATAGVTVHPRGPDAPVDRRATESERPGRAAGERFRPAHRLLEGRDFQRVLRSGRRRAQGELVVVLAPPGPRRLARGADRSSAAEPTGSRLGITVGRKVAPRAVDRNRFKRRVRDWFRRYRRELVRDVDLVVIARTGAAQLSGREIARRLADLTRTEMAQGRVSTRERE